LMLLTKFFLIDAMDTDSPSNQTGYTIEYRFRGDRYSASPIFEGTIPKAFLESVLAKKNIPTTQARELVFADFSKSQHQRKLLLTVDDMNRALHRNGQKLRLISILPFREKLNIYSVCQNGTIDDLNQIIWHNEFLANSEKIDLNKKDIYGKSPLMIAVHALHYDLIKRLIWYGADWNAITEQESLFQDALLRDNTNLRTGLIFLLQHINKRQKKSELPLAPDLVQKLAYLQECSKQFKDPWSKYGFVVKDCPDIKMGLLNYPQGPNDVVECRQVMENTINNYHSSANDLSYIIHVIKDKTALDHSVLSYVFDQIRVYTNETKDLMQRSEQGFKPRLKIDWHVHNKIDKCKISHYVAVAKHLVNHCLDDIIVLPGDLQFIMQVNHAYPEIFYWGSTIINSYLKKGCFDHFFWETAQKYVDALNRRNRISPFWLMPPSSERTKPFSFEIPRYKKRKKITINIPVNEKNEFNIQDRHEAVCKHCNIPPILWNKYKLAENEKHIFKLSRLGDFPSPIEFSRK